MAPFNVHIFSTVASKIVLYSSLNNCIPLWDHQFTLFTVTLFTFSDFITWLIGCREEERVLIWNILKINFVFYPSWMGKNGNSILRNDISETLKLKKKHRGNSKKINKCYIMLDSMSKSWRLWL